MEIKQKVIKAKSRLINKTDYYKSSQTNERKQSEINRITLKKTKIHLKQVLNERGTK